MTTPYNPIMDAIGITRHRDARSISVWLDGEPWIVIYPERLDEMTCEAAYRLGKNGPYGPAIAFSASPADRILAALATIHRDKTPPRRAQDAAVARLRSKLDRMTLLVER